MCNIKKLETIQMSINRWLDKQTDSYLYNEILLSNNKEYITNMQNNMHKSQKY